MENQERGREGERQEPNPGGQTPHEGPENWRRSHSRRSSRTRPRAGQRVKGTRAQARPCLVQVPRHLQRKQNAASAGSRFTTQDGVGKKPRASCRPPQPRHSWTPCGQAHDQALTQPPCAPPWEATRDPEKQEGVRPRKVESRQDPRQRRGHGDPRRGRGQDLPRMPWVSACSLSGAPEPESSPLPDKHGSWHEPPRPKGSVAPGRPCLLVPPGCLALLPRPPFPASLSSGLVYGQIRTMPFLPGIGAFWGRHSALLPADGGLKEPRLEPEMDCPTLYHVRVLGKRNRLQGQQGPCFRAARLLSSVAPEPPPPPLQASVSPVTQGQPQLPSPQGSRAPTE